MLGKGCAIEPSTAEIGLAGEHIVCADLTLRGYTVAMMGQNSKYDLLAEGQRKGRILRVQVKAKLKESRPGVYDFYVRHGCLKKSAYVCDSFDMLALVALDIKKIAYIDCKEGAPTCIRVGVGKYTFEHNRFKDAIESCFD